MQYVLKRLCAKLAPSSEVVAKFGQVVVAVERDDGARDE